MKSFVSAFLALIVASAEAAREWKAPSSTDSRSPCPMMNTLANHGFLPHNGLDISMAILQTALSEAVNLDPAATAIVGALALQTSSTGNASTFHLADLDMHGVLEHDGSLSRQDIFFGDNHSFNETVWAQTLLHFTLPVISIETAAKARAAAIARAASVNPEFNMTAGQAQNSFIEQALYLSVFGSPTKGNAVTDHVKILFEEERLPYAEGFVRSNTTVTAANVLALVSQLATVVTV